MKKTTGLICVLAMLCSGAPVEGQQTHLKPLQTPNEMRLEIARQGLEIANLELQLLEARALLQALQNPQMGAAIDRVYKAQSALERESGARAGVGPSQARRSPGANARPQKRE